MDDDGTWQPHGGAETDGGVRRHVARAAASLEASPAELLGLALLLVGGVLCLAVLVWWAPPGDRAAPRDPPVPLDGGAASGRATVHVAGAVVSPGIVELAADARVLDAVTAAGGPSALADLGALNLARTVTDGERIEVPVRGAPAGGAPGGGAPGGAFDAQGRLDINRATVAELETLPGIGPVLARRIVDHREANGPFADPGELRDVPGIGERSFQQLADLVVVR